MKKNHIEVYKNGAKIRLKNRKIEIVKKEHNISLIFAHADKDANKPAVGHECLKGKVRLSRIDLSEEALEAICTAYMNYRRLMYNDIPE